MKTQVRAIVDYQAAALNTILNLTRSASAPLGVTQAQLALNTYRKYIDRGLKLELRDGTLYVDYVGPEGFASKLGKYFDDVGRFGGSHLAMVVASRTGARL